MVNNDNFPILAPADSEGITPAHHLPLWCSEDGAGWSLIKNAILQISLVSFSLILLPTARTVLLLVHSVPTGGQPGALPGHHLTISRPQHTPRTRPRPSPSPPSSSSGEFLSTWWQRWSSLNLSVEDIIVYVRIFIYSTLNNVLSPNWLWYSLITESEMRKIWYYWKLTTSHKSKNKTISELQSGLTNL